MENSTKDKRITNNYTMIDTNETLAQKEWSIQNASMTTIEDIVRVPLMRGSYTAERIIRDIDFEDFRSFIPSITKEEYEAYDSKCALFIKHGMHGFIAACRFDIPEDFYLNEDGEFQYFSNEKLSYRFYVYDGTMEGLCDKILEKDADITHRELDKVKKKVREGDDKGSNFTFINRMVEDLIDKEVIIRITPGESKKLFNFFDRLSVFASDKLSRIKNFINKIFEENDDPVYFSPKTKEINIYSKPRGNIVSVDDFLLTDRNNARRFSIRIENSDQDETLLIY